MCYELCPIDYQVYIKVMIEGVFELDPHGAWYKIYPY